MNSLLGFVLFSGLGWVGDIGLFSCAITLWGVSPAIANMFSATTAAMLVHIITRRILFKTKAVHLKSFLIYLFYTEGMIFLWALIIQWLAQETIVLFPVSKSFAAISAKILVTPFSLLLNYIITKLLSLGLRSN